METKKLDAGQKEELLKKLKMRFDANRHRHQAIGWPAVQAKLELNHEKLWTLSQMETTGGEPDVIGFDEAMGEYIFCDCSPESPAGRRSFCYDDQALQSRKANKPSDSAAHAAEAMGVDLLTEEQYHALQQLEEFDMKTSSWILTPAETRKQGGALFGDRRYGRVFIYHNGAESYYGARGFRGIVKV